MIKRSSVTFTVTQGETSGTFVCAGQTARCLLALVAAGDRGITALEVSNWALRLSAYVFELRNRFGLEVAMEREAHDGLCGPGWHGRYRLLSSVELVEVIDAAA